MRTLVLKNLVIHPGLYATVGQDAGRVLLLSLGPIAAGAGKLGVENTEHCAHVPVCLFFPQVFPVAYQRRKIRVPGKRMHHLHADKMAFFFFFLSLILMITGLAWSKI